MTNKKINVIAVCLRKKGWIPYVDKRQKPMWQKGIVIEDTKGAYELQQKIDKEGK